MTTLKILRFQYLVSANKNPDDSSENEDPDEEERDLQQVVAKLQTMSRPELQALRKTASLPFLKTGARDHHIALTSAKAFKTSKAVGNSYYEAARKVLLNEASSST